VFPGKIATENNKCCANLNNNDKKYQSGHSRRKGKDNAASLGGL
jgi:hypothetical protein